MNIKEVDYIIVGAGLAGSVLAHQLLKYKKNIIIVSSAALSPSSMVAAGLYNPITGKKFLKTWKSETILPYMANFYKEVESLLQTKFFFPMPIEVPIETAEEHNIIHGRSAYNEEEEIKIFIKPFDEHLKIKNPLGVFYTNNTGFVDVEKFLMTSWKYFSNQNLMVEDLFDGQDMELENTKVNWKNFVAKKIIFCEGYRYNQNLFFDWVPIVPTKGELLKVRIEDFYEDIIFRKKVFLIPNGDNEYKCGSTYRWEFEDDKPTPIALKELKEHLEDLIKSDYLVLEHLSGIRPASRDRKPVLGLHPIYSTLAMFNGLGSKGVSMAPYFAQQLVLFLEEEKKLDREINIQRYYKCYTDHVEKNSI